MTPAANRLQANFPPSLHDKSVETSVSDAAGIDAFAQYGKPHQMGQMAAMSQVVNIGTEETPVLLPTQYLGGFKEWVVGAPLVLWVLWLAIPGVSGSVSPYTMLITTCGIVALSVCAHRRSKLEYEWGQIPLTVYFIAFLTILWLGAWLAPYGHLWGLLSVAFSVKTMRSWWRRRRQHLQYTAGLAEPPVRMWSPRTMTWALAVAGSIGFMLLRLTASDTAFGILGGVLSSSLAGGFAPAPLAGIYKFYILRKARMEGPFTPETLP